MNQGYTVQAARAGFNRPEQVLRRAEELQNVGQSQEALQAIHEVLVNKRMKTWSKQLEIIVTKFIDLCIQDRNGRVAKEGLVQFRNVCQQVNIGSLEEVVLYYIKKAEEKAQLAQSKAQEAQLLIEDHEHDGSPEELMLSYVSADNQRDRMDRELVMPWFRLLWETYRNCLDILKNNAKLEKIYRNVALKAFRFCQGNQRTNEFKRLCDILRMHLQQLNKSYAHLSQKERPNRTELTNTDTLSTYLEIRYEQLKVACNLELWQEAFRSIIDIEGLLSLEKGPKKPVRKQIQIDYFSKLTEIFSISQQHHLYRGFAWLNLFQRVQLFSKNMPQQDQQSLATACVLSALSIPPYDRTTKDTQSPEYIKDQRQRLGRMANILLYQVDPKQDLRTFICRQKLLEELQTKGVLNLVPKKVIDLYKLMEYEFDPLTMCKRVDEILQEIDIQPMSASAPVKQINIKLYAQDIRRNAALLMFKQLSKGYSSMRMSRVQQNIPYMDLAEIQQLIVDAVKYGYLEIQLNHQLQGITFDQQNAEQDVVRQYMMILSRGLNQAVKQINQDSYDENKRQRILGVCQQILGTQKLGTQIVAENGKQHEWLDKQALTSLKTLLEKEHNDMIVRKNQIEKIRQNEEKAEREAIKKRQALQQQKLIQERELQSRNQLDQSRVQQQQTQAQSLQDSISAREVSAQLERKPQRKFDIVLMGGQQQDEAKERERNEQEKKLTRMYKNIDFLERARREKETPIIEQYYNSYYQSLKQQWDDRNQEISQQNRLQWEEDIKIKNQVESVFKDKEEFMNRVIQRRENQFNQIRLENEHRRQEQREQEHLTREIQRKKAYLSRCYEQVSTKFEKEVERIKETKRERERLQQEAEENERQEKFKRQAEIQRKRETDIERKAQEEKLRDREKERDRGRPFQKDTGTRERKKYDFSSFNQSKKEEQPKIQQNSTQPQSQPQPQPQTQSQTTSTSTTGGYKPPYLRNKQEPSRQQVDSSFQDSGRKSQTQPARRKFEISISQTDQPEQSQVTSKENDITQAAKTEPKAQSQKQEASQTAGGSGSEGRYIPPAVRRRMEQQKK